ncbi:MAG: DUF4349 domain-containing protein [Bacillota bacterium]
MRCQDALEMLSPYLDGVLAPAEREAVRVHLTCCPRCSAELDELRASLRLLKELPELTPPAGFRAGLMERIDQNTAPKQVPQHKSWLGRVTGAARSTWYRTAAVAAVMAMTLGLTALWEKDGNHFLPVDPVPKEPVVVVQEPQQPAVDRPAPRDGVPEPAQGPNSGTPKPDAASPDNGGTPDVTPIKPNGAPNDGSIKQGEGFVPKPSEGLVAGSAVLKLDVENVEKALKSVGTLVQNKAGSVYQPYAGSEETGTISIKIPRSNYHQVIGSLQNLGDVITYLPTEKDLSAQHKEATEKMEQLKSKQAELQANMTEEPNPELQSQLAEVNASLEEKISAIKQLEERSSFCLITITLM